MSPKCRYYLNALFDLELGGYPLEQVRRSAAEMTVLFVPIAAADDQVVLDVGIPKEYREYLRMNSTPDAPRDRDRFHDGGYTDVVWGWNNSAVDRLSVGSPSHQLIENVIARINNRKFCHTCAVKYGCGVPHSQYCDTADTFDHVLNYLDDYYPLVLKPAFGGSGFGFHVLDGRTDIEGKRTIVEYYCAHGGCVIEPWYQRIADIATCLHINANGGLGTLLLHQQRVNRFGAFYGIYICDDDPVIQPWCNEIARIAKMYGTEVAASGYRGPLGIDSFIYYDRHGTEQCAVGIEINGRYTMGLLAHQIRRLFAPDKQVFFRTLSTKWCRLPDTYTGLAACLGNNQFDPEKGEGILLLTPLSVEYHGNKVQPQRNVFFITGNSESQIFAFDLALRRAVAPDHLKSSIDRFVL